MMNALQAAKAYAQVQGGPAAPFKSLAEEPKGPDFSQMVTGVMNSITQTGKAAESQVIAHANGKAELVDVVTSLASAQESLETAIAVRDQVIAAYNQIMAMPI
jgi:flagellar hook-basal body complex protein FliE